MKKGLVFLLSVLLLMGCRSQPEVAQVPADEARAIASSAGTDLDWTWATVATVPAREVAVVYEEADVEVLAEAIIEPVHWSALGFKTGGAVVEVLVEEGDVVQAGALLVRLDPAQTLLAVEREKAGLKIAQAKLALAKANQRAEEIAIAEAQLEAAQWTVEQASAQRDYVISGPTEAEIAAAKAQIASALRDQIIAEDMHDDMMKPIVFRIPWGRRTFVRRYYPTLGTYEEQTRWRQEAADAALAAAKVQLDQLLEGVDANEARVARADILSAVAQQDLMQAQLDQVQAAAPLEEIAVAEAGVAEARAAVEAAQAALALTEVRAPFAGTVTSINVETGSVVGSGQVACVLAVLDQFQARTTDLPELDVGQVVEGRPALVTVDALEGQHFAGVARQIALKAEDFQGQVVYPVTVQLMDTAGAPLRWGMRAWVEFEIP